MSLVLRFDQAVPPPRWGHRPLPLTLEVPHGAMCVIEAPPAAFGPLLRCCAGLVSPLSGRMEVLGVEPARLTRSEARDFRRRLGVGLRPGGLLSNQTVRSNVMIPLLHQGGGDVEAARTRADQVLADCGLLPWADRRPDDTPPDVRQAAVVARALACGPELLLLEDPFSAVDPEQTERLLDLCCQTVPTILVATHREDAVLTHFADFTVTWNTKHPESHEVGTV